MDRTATASRNEDRPRSASVRADRSGSERLTLTIEGRLDSVTTGRLWRDVQAILEKNASPALVVDAAGIDYCDMSGIGLLINLGHRQKQSGGTVEIRNLSSEFQQLMDLFHPEDLGAGERAQPRPTNLVEEVGRATYQLWTDARGLIAFVGELSVALAFAVTHPARLRWKDAFLVAERAGVNALPIIALISLMVGWIIGFQAAIPMKQFAAEIFVADLVGITMLRELGPLMTALILAGRSSSAFAAELGTMKVNEEIDALTTMGLDPVRFLVSTRVLATVAMIPLLTIFADLTGVVGGGFVLLSMGYPLVTYVNRVLAAVGSMDFVGGLVKTLFFGLLIAGIGCMRGLRTKTGASAVGESATSAVVLSVILIIVVDAVFAVVYFALGI